MPTPGFPQRPEAPTYKKDLPILHGLSTIQVYEQVGEEGDMVEWQLRGLQTLVDDCYFKELDQYEWFWIWVPERNSHYVKRLQETGDGGLCWVEMGSEVLRIHSRDNN